MSTVIISVAIPLSLILTLMAMYLLGQTLNIFTLGGLALAIGRLVDDSIVELENINRHLDMPGKDRRLAVLDAAREVAMPIFVSTITTIVVSCRRSSWRARPDSCSFHYLHHLLFALRLLPRLTDGHPPDVPPFAQAAADS